MYVKLVDHVFDLALVLLKMRLVAFDLGLQLFSILNYEHFTQEMQTEGQ